MIIVDKAWLVLCRTLFLQELETCYVATKNTKSELTHTAEYLLQVALTFVHMSGLNQLLNTQTQ